MLILLNSQNDYLSYIEKLYEDMARNMEDLRKNTPEKSTIVHLQSKKDQIEESKSESVYSEISTSTEIQPSRETIGEPPSSVETGVIIIRGKEGRLSGREITRIIDSAHFTTAAIVVDRIIRKAEVKIICSSKNDTEILLRDLKQNEILNKKIISFKQTPRLQKSIILNVPEQVTEEYIVSSINGEYILRKEDLIVLRNQSAKNPGLRNWIVLLSPSLLRAIIEDKGILLGASKYKVCPLTTVARCNNCQMFTHPTKFCQNKTYCANCGKNHEEKSCQNESSCINCNESNKRDNTTYDINHKASSFTCPIYKILYDKERKKLNEQFFRTVTPKLNSYPPLKNSSAEGRSRDESAIYDIPPFPYGHEFYSYDGGPGGEPGRWSWGPQNGNY